MDTRPISGTRPELWVAPCREGDVGRRLRRSGTRPRDHGSRLPGGGPGPTPTSEAFAQPATAYTDPSAARRPRPRSRFTRSVLRFRNFERSVLCLRNLDSKLRKIRIASPELRLLRPRNFDHPGNSSVERFECACIANCAVWAECQEKQRFRIELPSPSLFAYEFRGRLIGLS